MKQTKVQLQPIVPPSSLLQDCPVDKPPELTGLYQLDVPILVKAWVGQTLNLGKCSVDKQELREWKKKVQVISKNGGS